MCGLGMLAVGRRGRLLGQRAVLLSSIVHGLLVELGGGLSIHASLLIVLRRRRNRSRRVGLWCMI